MDVFGRPRLRLVGGDGNRHLKLFAQQTARRRQCEAWLVDVLVIGLAVSFAARCFAASCRIDPNTGQVICDERLGSEEQRAIEPVGPEAPDGPVERLPALAHCRVTLGDGSMGSGTLVAKDARYGTIITAWHLFRESSRCRVHFTDGSSYPAGIIALDQAADLAFLRIAAPTAAPITINEADPAGTVWLCGFGQPGIFRPVEGQVVNRSAEMAPGVYATLIGAAVRQGDSGGAVIDQHGYLVGVISAGDKRGTYATCGRPLARLLDRLWPKRPGRLLPGATSSVEAPTPIIPSAWKTHVDAELVRLEREKQQVGPYVTQSAIDERAAALADALDDAKREAGSQLSALSSQVLRLGAAADATRNGAERAAPGLVDAMFSGLAGLGWGKLLGATAVAGSGVGLPVAGVYAAKLLGGYLVGRRRARRSQRVPIDSPPNSQPAVPAPGPGGPGPQTF